MSGRQQPGPPVIAIDGPSGSGKGTISRAVASGLGWHLLDSGALYRLVALAANGRGVELDDSPSLAEVARNLDVRFAAGRDGSEQIYLAGVEVTRDVRSERCGNDASKVAAQPEVRAALVDLQHGFRKPPGLVADGRDMGSVIFPGAVLKIFLTASAEERANRRHKQLKEKGIDVSLAALSSEIGERDRRDAERPVAPLKASDDAVVLDTTKLSVAEVVDRVLALARERIPESE